MNDLLSRKWHDLLHAWAVDPSLATPMFEDICKHYSGPGRFYHTLDHVMNMMETVESLGSCARNLDAVKLATWLHDVIYDSRASDNEERSADFAERLCAKLAIPDSRLVASLIQTTKTHAAPKLRSFLPSSPESIGCTRKSPPSTPLGAIRR